MNKRLLSAVFIFLSAAGNRGSAAAQAYPSRPITIVIPGPAGGPGDLVARPLVERMRRSLGQPIVIENVAGANGTIATARVVRAAPDGYTLILGNWNSHVGASAVYSVPYDILKDLEPVSLVTFSLLWLVGAAGIPPHCATELIAAVK